MNKVWKVILLLVVFLPIASLGILGCGSSEPEPQTQSDFDAAANEEQVDAERAADAAAPGVAAPEGEETLPEEGP